MKITHGDLFRILPGTHHKLEGFERPKSAFGKSGWAKTALRLPVYSLTINEPLLCARHLISTLDAFSNATLRVPLELDRFVLILPHSPWHCTASPGPGSTPRCSNSKTHDVSPFLPCPLPVEWISLLGVINIIQLSKGRCSSKQWYSFVGLNQQISDLAFRGWLLIQMNKVESPT